MVYKIKISPESLSSIVKEITYSGNTFGVYTGMTSLLTSGVNGTSSLTGLTIPILLTQDCFDIGYYSEFDGAIQQKETALNYIFSANSEYEYCIYNTSILSSYTKGSEYEIYWGDNSKVEPMIGFKSCHTYPKTNAKYVIKLTQKNNFGTNIISKTITIPFDKNKVSDNPNGTVEFIPSGGPWKDSPISYDYIFTGDTGMDIDEYVYDSVVTITGYTIQDINYVDYPFGVTTFEVKSKGLTKDTAKLVPITKNEALLKSVDEVQIFSNVFVERGKNSGYEKVQRLGEVKTLQDMEKYGYGYFKLTNK